MELVMFVHEPAPVQRRWKTSDLVEVAQFLEPVSPRIWIQRKERIEIRRWLCEVATIEVESFCRLAYSKRQSVDVADFGFHFYPVVWVSGFAAEAGPGCLKPIGPSVRASDSHCS